MTWLTWRQFRLHAVAVGAGLAALLTVLVVTASELARLAEDTGAAACTGRCDDVIRAFTTQATTGTLGIALWGGIGTLVLLPAIVGVFWGAPLIARELESGTHRLAWTQSISRTRWLAVKLAGVGAAVVAATTLAAVAVTWWSGPFDAAVRMRMQPELFAARGVAPIGYAVLAFVVGVLAGTIVRRTVPAMAITLVVVAAAQVVMPLVVREHLAEPVRIDAPFDSSRLDSLQLAADGTIRVEADVDAPGAWVLANETVTADGAVFTGPYNVTACRPAAGGNPQRCHAWLDSLGLRQLAAHHPAERFWTLQWRETAVLIALAAALAAACFWWVRRRLV